MPATTITFSTASIPGFSGVANLAWRNGCPISAAVFPSTTLTSTGVFTIQYTMDDVQLVGGASVALWSNYSSTPGVAGTVYNASSPTDGAAFFIEFKTPVAALRLSSTALSSGPLIMKILQGESW